jgi:hypothetical protein
VRGRARLTREIAPASDKSSPIRVLLALDNEQAGSCLLTHVKLLARTDVVTARVHHVVEQATVVGFSTTETTEEAQALVDGATSSLQLAGSNLWWPSFEGDAITVASPRCCRRPLYGRVSLSSGAREFVVRRVGDHSVA